MPRRFILTAARLLLLALLAGVPACAYAAPGTSILMLGSHFADRDVVWMGKIDTTTPLGSYAGPLSWIVLDGDKAYDGTTDGATILSKCAYSAGPFARSLGQIWAHSLVQERMQSFLADSNHFSDAERALFMPMTVASVPGCYDALNNELIYALSSYDVDGPDIRYLKTNAERRAQDITMEGVYDAYWLRSTFSVAIHAIDRTGNRWDYFSYNDSIAMRPAASLAYESIGMISSVGGKANGAGSFAKNAMTPTGEYTMTLFNPSLKVQINVDSVAATTLGGTVSIPYEGATYGANNYISALISQGDPGDSVLYYARLRQVASASDAAGTLSVTIPAGLDAEGDYTLRLFLEQYNGGASRLTDYMSSFRTIPLGITKAAAVPATGDTQQPLLWLCLGAASAVGLAILLMGRKHALPRR